MAQLKSTLVQGALTVTGNAVASKLIKNGGTSDDILLGDGSTTSKSALMAMTNAVIVLKGTVGTNGTVTKDKFPAASESTLGDAYKVITKDTYQGVAAKVGDMLICYYTGSRYDWMLIPSGDDIEDTWREIKVNGTQILANGTTTNPLNLKAGANMTLTNSNGTVTFDATDTGATTVSITGDGNAFTNAEYNASTRTITFTKGSKFLTSHQSLANYVTLNGNQIITGIKTFSHSNFGAIILKRDGSANASSVIFQNSNGTLGSVGMTGTANGGLKRWTANTNTVYTIWDSGNDGSGSGLDADLLDGQEGSYYLNYNNFTNKPTIPNPTSYYWANIKVSDSSSTSTSPTFAEVYSDYGNFEWVGAMNGLCSNNLYVYGRSSDMYIGDPDYGDGTPNHMYLTAHDSIELNIRGCTVKLRQASGTVALTSDYWADVQLSGVSSTTTTPQFLRAKIGNAKRAVTCDPRTTVSSTGDTSLISNLPTGHAHLGLLTWDGEAGFIGVNGDNAILCTPGDPGIFNVSGYLFILDEDIAFNNSSYKAYVDANGAWKTNSDIRLKTNINNYPSVLESIKQLDIITYTYIDRTQEKRSETETRLAEAQEILQRPLLSAKQAEEAQDTIKDCERILHRLNEKRNKMEIGLSAQQIEEKLPMPELFISKNPDEQLGYKYTLSEAKLVFAAIKAIQEQQTIIENQQKLIDNLTQEVAEIKAIIGRGDNNE